MEAKQVRDLMEAYASVYQEKEEAEQLDEFLGAGAAQAVDSAIKKVQTGLEKIGVPINRTPRGTVTGAEQKQRIQQNVAKEEVEVEEVELDEAGLPYGPVGKGFRKIPAGRQREAMMNRANTLRKKAMAASPEGDGGKGSSRGKMGEINAALLNPRLRPENVSYESDMFDIILEHLVAEGYADTNKAALAIMANMSEEWKQSILSEDPVQDYRDMRRAAENKGGARGPELSHGPDTKAKPTPPTAASTGQIKPTNTNRPNSSVSSPGYDTRRIGGYDLRRLSN